MNFQGLEVIDLRQPHEAWPAIGNVIGIALHHSVTDVDIDPGNDLASIEAIRQYHERLWGNGIGYHLIVGDDGTPYYVGDLATQRAHVWGRNHELVGVCLLGDYTNVQPPDAQLRGAARIVVALRAYYGWGLPCRGHKQWARPESPTACPGDTWDYWRPKFAAMIAALEEDDMTAEQRKVVAALFKAIGHLMVGEVEEAKAMIRYLAG